MNSYSDQPPSSRLGMHLLAAARQDTVSESSPLRAGSAADEVAATFAVSITDGDQRTLTMSEIVAAYNEGDIEARTYVWTDGMEDWQPLQQVEAIVDALYREAAQADPDAAARPRSEPTRQAHPAPIAAPVDTPSRAQPESNRPARSDDSAIFSLDQLLADAAPSSTSSGFARDEDSGLIDLEALAAGVPRDADSLELAPWTGSDLFPLGAPAAEPAPIPTAGPASAPTQRKGNLLLASMATLALLLAAAVVFLLVKGTGAPVDVAASTANGAQPSPATTAETPSATPMARTEPSATGTATETTTAATSAPSSRPVAQLQTRPRPAPTQAKPPRAGPAKDATGGGSKDCRCPADDLMCHMRCRQRK